MFLTSGVHLPILDEDSCLDIFVNSCLAIRSPSSGLGDEGSAKPWTTISLPSLLENVLYCTQKHCDVPTLPCVLYGSKLQKNS